MIDFDFILRFGKASDTLGKWKSKPLTELPFGLVKIEIPELLNRGKTEDVVIKILKHQYSDFELKHTQGEIIAFVLWVKNQIEFINKIENAYLHSEPEPELIASGVHLLDEFGVMVTIDNLAGGDILKYDKIKALPYFEVYQKLKMDKIQNEIKNRYEKIMTEKSKRKY